jgi:hypothetical protein
VVFWGRARLAWLQGVRNPLRQNSFWLQRLDLNERTSAEAVLTGQGFRLSIRKNHNQK